MFGRLSLPRTRWEEAAGRSITECESLLCWGASISGKLLSIHWR
jgi:hypothetical protein